jgi:hypothetical protein
MDVLIVVAGQSRQPGKKRYFMAACPPKNNIDGVTSTGGLWLTDAQALGILHLMVAAWVVSAAVWFQIGVEGRKTRNKIDKIDREWEVVQKGLQNKRL